MTYDEAYALLTSSKPTTDKIDILLLYFKIFKYFFNQFYTQLKNIIFFIITALLVV